MAIVESLAHAPSPAATPATADHAVIVRRVPWRGPFQWLRAGWHDYKREPGIGSFYGLCFMAMGWALQQVFAHAPVWTLALSAGFLLVGPFLCMGLYQVSMDLERGEPASLGASLTAWRDHLGQMAIFGFVLLVLEMLWGRASLVVFAVSFDGMPDFKGSLLALLDPQNIGFIVTYLVVGAVFASLIFAVSVVSIPMMLDRQVDAVTAGLTSLRLVLGQPGVMLLWAGLLSLLVVLALLPGFLGLLVVGPVLGHASWHAYRATIGEA